MDPFDAALDVVYENPDIAVDAVWMPPDGAPVVDPVRVIFFERPRGAKLDRVRQPHDGPVITHRISDPFVPDADGVFAIGARSFRVQRRDRSRDGRDWMVDVEEVAP